MKNLVICIAFWHALLKIQTRSLLLAAHQAFLLDVSGAMELGTRTQFPSTEQEQPEDQLKSRVCVRWAPLLSLRKAFGLLKLSEQVHGSGCNKLWSFVAWKSKEIGLIISWHISHVNLNKLMNLLHHWPLSLPLLWSCSVLTHDSKYPHSKT